MSFFKDNCIVMRKSVEMYKRLLEYSKYIMAYFLSLNNRIRHKIPVFKKSYRYSALPLSRLFLTPHARCKVSGERRGIHSPLDHSFPGQTSPMAEMPETWDGLLNARLMLE
jgi:hypothetical protein